MIQDPNKPKPQTPDPFAAMGGGVQTANGDWVPKDHPNAQPQPVAAAPAPAGAVPPAQAPAAPVAAAPAPAPAPATPDPFAAMGGGVQLANGDWVPRDHPLAASAPQAAAAAPQAAPGTPAAPTVESTYKDALLKLLSDDSTPSLDDPALKAQSNAFGVQQTRAKERAREAMAERRASQGQLSDLAGSGAFDRDLVGLEQAQGEGQARFNAGLLGNEAQAKRQQLMQALGLAGQDLNADEARALQDRLAQLDAQIRREGIAQQGSLGGQELALRDKLGSGGLNMQLLGLLSGNQNFQQGLGADLGKFNAGLNQQALLSMLGQL